MVYRWLYSIVFSVCMFLVYVVYPLVMVVGAAWLIKHYVIG